MVKIEEQKTYKTEEEKKKSLINERLEKWIDIVKKNKKTK